MMSNPTSAKISEILTCARSQIRMPAPTVSAPKILEKELRRRRKHYLGSYISLRNILEDSGGVNNEVVDALSQHLAKQTLLYWCYNDNDAESFCYHFYRLTMFALLSGEVRECVDDIIQICSAMVRSKEVFQIVEQDMLPPEMFSELFSFLEDSCDEYFTMHFEDAVLFTIASFLGVLANPGASSATDNGEEASV